MILTVISRKGGPGKTTISTSFAAFLRNRWENVAIVDADPQGSSVKWGERRKKDYVEEDHVPVIHQTGDLENSLRRLKNTYDYIIVDCVGKDSIELRSSLVVADCALIPVIPSELDREQVPYLSNVIEKSKSVNRNLKIFSVVSIAHKDDKAEIRKTQLCLRNNHLNPTKSIIKSRLSYKSMMAEGLGGTESNDPIAVKDMSNLINEVLS